MPADQSLESLCAEIRAGDITPLQIKQRALQSERAHAALNCFVRADLPENEYREPGDEQKDLPLYGIPISFKDNIFVAGLPITAGTPGLADCVASHDAEIVKRLTRLGVAVAGKNTMHELSFGITSASSVQGAVGNPAASGYCAGGSSGGSAAAVAAGIVSAAVGTDTGGSVRIPASFCGITGFRPTSGHWSSSGILPVSHTKDTPGLLARTVADVLFLYTHLSCGDVQPSAVLPSACRIGLPSSMWNGLNGEVRKHCQACIDLLARYGFECVAVDDARIVSLSTMGAFTIPISEFFVDFPRSLLVNGLGSRIAKVFDQIGDENIRSIIHTNMKSKMFSNCEYQRALHGLHLLREEMDAFFDSCRIDLLAYPTVPGAVPHRDTAGHPDLFGEIIRNTDLASNAALPSVTLPVAPLTALPVGLSLDCKRGRHGYLLHMASLIESILRSHAADPAG
ncbi:amidase [Xanthomonas arboricola pv. populi]|uniref:Amidase n=1 Tax=Xanthomonas arboricola pv. populi TaxID=487823 RepID=A0A2S6Z2E1_9XANT|nr:amidase family protein [Xanthomonas arboricola]PPT75045.1 amidase [Xanthomonas arboricola pv. populi]